MPLSTRFDTRTLSLTATCVALNLVAGKVTNLLSLPIYFDSIGTILSAAIVPAPLPILAGAATSLLAWIVIHPAYIFYIGTQIAIAITSIIAFRMGAFQRWWTAILAGFAIAVVAAIVSAPVTVMVFGGVTLPSVTAINAVLIAAGQNIWKAVVQGSIIIEAIDKTAACLLAWVIVKRLPKRVLGNA